MSAGMRSQRKLRAGTHAARCGITGSGARPKPATLVLLTTGLTSVVGVAYSRHRTANDYARAVTL